MRARLILAAVALCAAGVVPQAMASQLVGRTASAVRLDVNGKREALLTYHAGGRWWHVLAWGAVNARAPSLTVPQVAFRLDYAGGNGKYHRSYWKGFRNLCGPYTGPPLEWLVTACTASDGSYWALQAWPRALPNYGVRPSRARAGRELRLSHWSGAPAVLTVRTDWAYRRFDHLYGSLVYNGKPVYGFRSTRLGNPLDGYGRLIYVDTFNSRYGRGWQRENGFLTHRPNGVFCYGFWRHGSHPVGRGTRYRVTAVGPGVTPDVVWAGQAPGRYDRTADQRANAEQRALFPDGQCRPN